MQPSFKLKPFVSSDLKEAYSKYKEAFIAVIENTFGWNEEFQQERFLSRYELNWFYWIEINNECVGYVCFWQKSLEIHISLLIIDSDKRKLGHGHLVMSYIHKKANDQNCTITLSSFRKNQPAIRFYESIGYNITGGDEHFIDMEKSVF